MPGQRGQGHLGALYPVYNGVVGAHRNAIGATEDSEFVTQDMLIEPAGPLERFQRFVRAHLKTASSENSTRRAVRRQARRTACPLVCAHVFDARA